ncbi:hypothetical protein Q8A73_012700 [Channa argus]|nr:hypothetical protein Q8A73_012700 [Channa argus]
MEFGCLSSTDFQLPQEGRLVYQSQNPLYAYRTALFGDQLMNGTLAGLDESTSGVLLQCESKGWYPEPEVLWLDVEGNVLSAGPTETVRGPDDLYTVSSRVTVDKRHGNTFTCRVQQQRLKQTKVTEIHVPDDFFMVPASCAAYVGITAVTSSSDDQDLPTNSRVIVDEIDPNGKYIRLRNTFNENQTLGNWKLDLEINKKSNIYKFSPGFILNAEEMVTIWASDAGHKPEPPGDLVWENQKSWSTKETLKATLKSPMGEV